MSHRDPAKLDQDSKAERKKSVKKKGKTQKVNKVDPIVLPISDGANVPDVPNSKQSNSTNQASQLNSVSARDAMAKFKTEVQINIDEASKKQQVKFTKEL